MKKFLTIALAVMMVLALFAGCNSNSETTPTTAPTQAPGATATTAPDKNAETLEIEYMIIAGSEESEPGYLDKLVEEALNIKLSFRVIDGNETEAVNLMFASGDYPDAFVCWNDAYTMYTKDELVASFDKQLVYDNAPQFAEKYDANPVLWTIMENPDDDSKVVGMSGYGSNSGSMEQYWWVDYIRYDWIKELGIDLGVEVNPAVEGKVYMAEDALTMEKYEEILEKFTEKTGYAALMGWNGNGAESWGFLTLQRHFQFTSRLTGTVWDNGESVWWYTSSQYKEFLAWMIDAYNKGWIDREWMSTDRATMTEKLCSEMGGVTCTSANWMATWARDRAPYAILDRVEGAEILVTPGIYDKDGTYGTQNYGMLPTCNGYMYVSIEHEDDIDYIGRCLQIFNYVYANPDVETRFLHTYGREGIDFEYVDGVPTKFTDEVWNEKNGTDTEKVGNLMAGGQFQDPLQLSWGQDAYFAAMFPWCVGADATYCKNMKTWYPAIGDPLNQTELSILNQDYGLQRATITTEFFWKCVMGQADMNADWDAYIAQLEADGNFIRLEENNKGIDYKTMYEG